MSGRSGSMGSRPTHVDGMRRDLEDLHRLGILVRDIKIFNYMGEGHIDFSWANQISDGLGQLAGGMTSIHRSLVQDFYYLIMENRICTVKDDCHRMIDTFSQMTPTGYIVIRARFHVKIHKGSRAATVINKFNQEIAINGATLAVNFHDPPFGIMLNDEKAQLPAERKCNEPMPPGTTYITYDFLKPVPVECHQVIAALSLIRPNGYIDIPRCQSMHQAVGGCAAYICNQDGVDIRASEARLAQNMTVNILSRCALNKKFCTWMTNDYQAALWECPPTHNKAASVNNVTTTISRWNLTR
ncbi:hypothetical protein VTI74DRAFT_1890 [Chaetomium olivicolor]